MTTSPATDPVALLAELVRYRTDIEGGDERALADHLAVLLRQLGADEVIVDDVPRASGKNASYVYARYGRPRLLVNVHIDTVPVNADWTSDPFTPKLEGGRLYALGAADTKGAIASILTALATTKPNDTAILFSGDEETGGAVIRHLVTSPLMANIERAIVCEPTRLAAGTQHRGISSFEVVATGPGGHSSLADKLPAPIAELARLGVALDDWARARRLVGPPGFEGMCLNLAKLDGGIAFNVIPAEAKLVVSIRPPPGADPIAVRQEIEDVVTRAAPGKAAAFVRDNPPFATRRLMDFEPLLGEIAKIPVDLGFWTEAAILSGNGIDAVVFGPGDIAQAHAPDEWVETAQLVRARDIFQAMFRDTR